MPKNKIVLIPYAGAIENSFFPLKELLKNKYEVITVELRGHGRRYSEGECFSWSELVEDVEKSIENKIGKEDDYSILGYSMGAKLVYEIVQRRLQRYGKEPVHVFWAASEPPNIPINAEHKTVFTGIKEIDDICDHDIQLSMECCVKDSEIQPVGCNTKNPLRTRSH